MSSQSTSQLKPSPSAFNGKHSHARNCIDVADVVIWSCTGPATRSGVSCSTTSRRVTVSDRTPSAATSHVSEWAVPDGLAARSVVSPEVVAVCQPPATASEYWSVTPAAASDSASIRVKETATAEPVTADALEMPSAGSVVPGVCSVAVVGLSGSRSSPTWWFSQK